jgi:TPR repeat protein
LDACSGAGYGVPVDQEMAVSLLIKSVQAGQPEAQEALSERGVSW